MTTSESPDTHFAARPCVRVIDISGHACGTGSPQSRRLAGTPRSLPAPRRRFPCDRPAVGSDSRGCRAARRRCGLSFGDCPLSLLRLSARRSIRVGAASRHGAGIDLHPSAVAHLGRQVVRRLLRTGFISRSAGLPLEERSHPVARRFGHARPRVGGIRTGRRWSFDHRARSPPGIQNGLAQTDHVLCA